MVTLKAGQPLRKIKNDLISGELRPGQACLNGSHIGMLRGTPMAIDEDSEALKRFYADLTAFRFATLVRSID